VALEAPQRPAEFGRDKPWRGGDEPLALFSGYEERDHGADPPLRARRDHRVLALSSVLENPAATCVNLAGISCERHLAALQPAPRSETAGTA
jgi:hypothetical protein